MTGSTTSIRSASSSSKLAVRVGPGTGGSALTRSIASTTALTRALRASGPRPRWLVRSMARGVTAE